MKGLTSDSAWVVVPALIGSSVGAAAAIFGGRAIRHWIDENYFFSPVKGVSMEPEYHAGDRLMIKRRGYQLHYGDVVLIRSSLLDEGENFCKRIIGLPGDMIELRGGKVIRNGEEVAESYLGDVQTKPRAGEGNIYRIKPNHVFVLGDNRPVSMDSRCKELGQVPISAIKGVVVGHWPEDSTEYRLLAALKG